VFVGGQRIAGAIDLNHRLARRSGLSIGCCPKMEAAMANETDNLLQQDFDGEGETLRDLGKGIVAGILATAAAGAVFWAQTALNLAPQFDFIGMLNMMADATWPGAGWIIFFAGGGVLLGMFFAMLDARVEATTGAGELARGAFFGALVWLLLMLVLMPVYGAGAFGLALGIGAPVFSFAANLVYGLVLGAVYGALHPETVPV
jgi:hypothetical protein